MAVITDQEILWEDRKHWLWFPFSFTKYTLTEDRLYSQQGFLNTHYDELLLYRVTDLCLTRSLGQKLCGTGTTAKLIAEATDLKVKRYLSGPLGGDQQIGAKVAEKKIDMVIFFWDPLESQPHDPDVKALLRIAVVYDIPIATNRATADYVIHSNMLE